MSPEGVADCKRVTKVMRSVATELGMTNPASLVLTAMRGRASVYEHVLGHRKFSFPAALGAVMECCARPPSVPDSPEYLHWLSCVWGD